MILLSFRKEYVEDEWQEPYFGYLFAIAGLQLSIEEVGRRSFVNECGEAKSFRYDLDNFPEEAISDLSIIYAEIQAYMSRVTSILSDMYSYKAELNKCLRDAKRIYKKARNCIFTTHKKIKLLKNQTQMEAFIDNYLSDIVEIRDLLDDRIEAVGDMIQIMVVHDKNLERANVNVSRQQRIVEVLINLNYPVHFVHKKRK